MFRLNNAWANSTVLRPVQQPEGPLFSQEFGLRLQVQAPVFELVTPMLGVERPSPSAIYHPRKLLLLFAIATLLMPDEFFFT